MEPSGTSGPIKLWIRTVAGVVGTDALGKIVLLVSSPILAAMLRPEEFGAYILLQAIWAVVMLAQFGGADWALPLRSSEAAGRERDEVFAGCSLIAGRALPLVWAVCTVVVLWMRPGGTLTTVEYGLFMAGLLPAGFAAWQLFVLRFARRSAEFAAGTLGLKTLAPVLSLGAALLWPVNEQRLAVFLSVGLFAYFAAAAYAYRLRRAVLPLDTVAAPEARARQLLITGLTLLPGGLAYATIWAADRIVANALWGPRAAGIVGVAALLGSTVLLMKVWLALIWEPLVVEWAGKQLGTALVWRIQRGFDWSALSFLSVATIGAIWGPWVVKVLYPPELAPAAALLPWYFAAAAFSGIAGIASATILLARAPRAHLAVQLTALAVCAATMGLAGPRTGLQGVVAGVLLAEVTILCSWLYLGMWYFKNLPLRLESLLLMVVAFGLIGWGCARLRSEGLIVEVAATALVAAVTSVWSLRLVIGHREVQIA